MKQERKGEEEVMGGARNTWGKGTRNSLQWCLVVGDQPVGLRVIQPPQVALEDALVVALLLVVLMQRAQRGQPHAIEPVQLLLLGGRGCGGGGGHPRPGRRVGCTSEATVRFLLLHSQQHNNSCSFSHKRACLFLSLSLTNNCAFLFFAVEKKTSTVVPFPHEHTSLLSLL